MDDVLETWSASGLDVYAGSPVRPADGRRERRLFLAKATFLLITTLALVPIMVLQSALGGAIYVGFLVIVHVVGLAVFAYGLRRQHFGVSLRGLTIRIGGLVLLTGLLYLASKGLTTGLSSAVFWISLIAIWALHTAGAAMLHLMPERRDSLCPFI